MFSLQSSWLWHLRMRFVFHVDLWLGFDCKNNLDNKRIVAWVNAQNEHVWSGAAGHCWFQHLTPAFPNCGKVAWRSILTINLPQMCLFADMFWMNICTIKTFSYWLIYVASSIYLSKAFRWEMNSAMFYVSFDLNFQWCGGKSVARLQETHMLWRTEHAYYSSI